MNKLVHLNINLDLPFDIFVGREEKNLKVFLVKNNKKIMLVKLALVISIGSALNISWYFLNWKKIKIAENI